MPRVAVPNGYESDYIPVAGTPPNENETRMGAPRDAVIRVPERYPRSLKVREDEDGRYVGCGVETAKRLRAHFAAEYGMEYADATTDTTTEADVVESDATTGGAVVETGAIIEAGDCPWCDDYDGEHVGQHASSAHPDEWAAYREAVDE